eukprot:GDKH01027130.1.p5 GENE.GDKH01027130.1~~GDKH01027130.1.p5  ORF type:complete len:52 (-),score=5.64 GDKH01027130.1:154-309(-)
MQSAALGCSRVAGLRISQSWQNHQRRLLFLHCPTGQPGLGPPNVRRFLRTG